MDTKRNSSSQYSIDLESIIPPVLPTGVPSGHRISNTNYRLDAQCDGLVYNPLDLQQMLHCCTPSCTQRNEERHVKRDLGSYIWTLNALLSECKNSDAVSQRLANLASSDACLPVAPRSPTSSLFNTSSSITGSSCNDIGSCTDNIPTRFDSSIGHNVDMNIDSSISNYLCGSIGNNMASVVDGPNMINCNNILPPTCDRHCAVDASESQGVASEGLAECRSYAAERLPPISKARRPIVPPLQLTLIKRNDAAAASNRSYLGNGLGSMETPSSRMSKPSRDFAPLASPSTSRYDADAEKVSGDRSLFASKINQPNRPFTVRGQTLLPSVVQADIKSVRVEGPHNWVDSDKPELHRRGFSTARATLNGREFDPSIHVTPRLPVDYNPCNHLRSTANLDRSCLKFSANGLHSAEYIAGNIDLPRNARARGGIPMKPLPPRTDLIKCGATSKGVKNSKTGTVTNGVNNSENVSAVRNGTANSRNTNGSKHRMPPLDIAALQRGKYSADAAASCRQTSYCAPAKCSTLSTQTPLASPTGRSFSGNFDFHNLSSRSTATSLSTFRSSCAPDMHACPDLICNHGPTLGLERTIPPPPPCIDVPPISTRNAACSKTHRPSVQTKVKIRPHPPYTSIFDKIGPTPGAVLPCFVPAHSKLTGHDVGLTLFAVQTLYADRLHPTYGMLQQRISELVVDEASIKDLTDDQGCIEAGKSPVVDCFLQLVNLNSELMTIEEHPTHDEKVMIRLRHEPQLKSECNFFVDAMSTLDSFTVDEWRIFFSYFYDRMSASNFRKKKEDSSKADQLVYQHRGGRYGLGRAISKANIPALAHLSVGHLCHMVQLARDRGVLVYEANVMEMRCGSLLCSEIFAGRLPSTKYSKRNTVLWTRLQQLLARLVDPYPKGALLANLKKDLREKMGFGFAIQEYGYRSLSALLTSDQLKGRYTLWQDGRGGVFCVHSRHHSGLAKHLRPFVEKRNDGSWPEDKPFWEMDLFDKTGCMSFHHWAFCAEVATRSHCLLEAATPRNNCLLEAATPRSDCLVEAAIPRSDCLLEAATPRSDCLLEAATPRSDCLLEAATPRSDCLLEAACGYDDLGTFRTRNDDFVFSEDKHVDGSLNRTAEQYIEALVNPVAIEELHRYLSTCPRAAQVILPAQSVSEEAADEECAALASSVVEMLLNSTDETAHPKRISEGGNCACVVTYVPGCETPEALLDHSHGIIRPKLAGCADTLAFPTPSLPAQVDNADNPPREKLVNKDTVSIRRQSQKPFHCYFERTPDRDTLSLPVKLPLMLSRKDGGPRQLSEQRFSTMEFQKYLLRVAEKGVDESKECWALCEDPDYRIACQGTLPQGTLPHATLSQGTLAQGTLPQGTLPQACVPLEPSCSSPLNAAPYGQPQLLPSPQCLIS